MKQTRILGFTLVELMIVVVIIGIVTGIAYPSYRNYITQTRRSDAQVALTRITALQEKFYSDCRYYARTLVGTRACGTAGGTDSVLGYTDLSPDRHYKLSLTAGNIAATCTAYDCGFIAIADPNGTGVSGQQANNGKLRIDSTGAKGWDKAGNNTYASRWTDK